MLVNPYPQSTSQLALESAIARAAAGIAPVEGESEHQIKSNGSGINSSHPRHPALLLLSRRGGLSRCHVLEGSLRMPDLLG